MQTSTCAGLVSAYFCSGKSQLSRPKFKVCARLCASLLTGVPTPLCSMGKTMLLMIMANPPMYLVDAFVAAVEEAVDLDSLWSSVCSAATCRPAPSQADLGALAVTV